MMQKFKQTIAFVGAGNMAAAIIGGLVEQGIPPQQIIASNRSPAKLQALEQHYAIRHSGNNNEAVAAADIVVLAVKPQQMQAVCEALAEAVPSLKDKLVISIAAGISVARLQHYIPGLTRVIRSMPNTPAQIGKGCSGLYAPPTVSAQDREIASLLLNAVGSSVWLENETQINAVIAAAGSAPAYFFLMMEAMQHSAEKLGLSPAQAKTLVTQAALGSSMLAEQSGTDFAALRAQVTSKGGTTHEAVETFKAGGMLELVDNAMQAAVKRAQEMEQLL